MTEEQELARRLHRLVDSPPAGRNLGPVIRKASARRRARIAVVGTGLGVTTVVVGAAAASGVFNGTSTSGSRPIGAGVASAGSSARSSSTALPSAASAPSATVTSEAAQAYPAPSASLAVKAARSTPAAGPAMATVAPGAGTVAALRSAPYYYLRAIGETNGVRTTVSSWTGRAGSSVFENVDPRTGKLGEAVEATDFHGEWKQILTWDDFSSVPSAAHLRYWVWGDSTRPDLAFKQAHDLLVGTPTTAAFRLAVLAEERKVPGVVTTSGVKDEAGRTGDGLRLGTHSYVISAEDGSLLQEDFEADPACSGDAAHVQWRTVYLESGAVPDTHSVLAAAPVTLTGEPAGPCS